MDLARQGRALVPVTQFRDQLCRLAMFIPFRLFEGLWRYTSVSDMQPGQ